MMKKISTLLALSIALSLSAQDVDFSAYDGTNSNPSTTKAASEDITVRFEDADIINNFYTEGRNTIYAYICYSDSTTSFQSCVGDFNNVTTTMLPVPLTAADGDSNVGPNEYEFTFNPQTYMSIPDGTLVTGLDIIFVNEFAGGGNNQTVNLSIDVDDRNLAIRDLAQASAKKNTFASNRLILSDSGNFTITVYNLKEQVVQNKKLTSVQKNQAVDLGLQRGNYIVQTIQNGHVENLKIIVE